MPCAFDTVEIPMKANIVSIIGLSILFGLSNQGKYIKNMHDSKYNIGLLENK